MSTVHASFWNAQTLDNRWWLCWLCDWTVLLFSIQAYAMMLSLSENTNLHSSSQNSLDAWLNMGGGPSETSSFHPLNNIWEHQQDKREMEGEKEERARDQHEELVQCHSRWTTTMRARRRTYCWVKQTQEPITDGRVLIHGIKTRTKSPNPSHTASFLSATSHYSEVPSSSADSRGSHAFEWLSNHLSTSFSMICIS